MSKGGEAALAALESRIGYPFTDRAVLRTALTHASALGGSPAEASYERLEFLGDRVLGLVVAEMLLEAFPSAAEGELSRRLAELVRKETCAEIAVELDLGGAIRIGGGRSQHAALQTTNVLGDLCEAIIAGIYQDGGFDAARRFVRDHWRERMLSPLMPIRNAKAALQEWAQARGLPTPVYSIAGRSGPDHAPLFEIEVAVEGLAPARGGGRSRREAEQAAAGAVLRREGVWQGEVEA